MTEEKLVEEILEIASELDRGDINFDEAKEKAELLVRIDRYEQLLITDVMQCYSLEDMHEAWDMSDGRKETFNNWIKTL